MSEPFIPPPRENPSAEILRTVIDGIAEGCTFADAMHRVNRKGNTIFSWLAKARAGVEGFTVRWPNDDETSPEIRFDEAVVLAQRAHLLHFRQRLVRDCDIGTPKVLRTPQGEVIYEKSAALLAEWGGDTPEAKSDAEILGGVWDYPYVHSGDGSRVAAIEHVISPAALRQHLARSLLEGFNPSDHQVRDVQHSGSVLITGATGGKPTPSYARPVTKPLTGLQRDLLARLESVTQNGPLHPRPDRPPVVLGRPNGVDDPPERTVERTKPSR